mgnify:FL=1
MPDTLRIHRLDVGRYAIGACRFPGAPIVVQISRAGRRAAGICVYGIFRGREVSLDNPGPGASGCDRPGDVVRLDMGDGERPPGGKIGIIRGERWIVLEGAEADAAWADAEVADA